VSSDRRHETHGEGQDDQPLANINDSRAEGDEETLKRRRAAIVADPTKRLAEGKTDPGTGEVKPAGS
jgi:hypothetical protein